MPENNVVMVIKLTFLGDNARMLVPLCHGHIIVSFHSNSNCMDKLPILSLLFWNLSVAFFFWFKNTFC